MCSPKTSAGLTLRVLEKADLDFADSLRAGEGWNQTLANWKRFIEFDPEGCFAAEFEGRPVGTITTIRYGSGVAWLGMLLVQPDVRGKGIGSALMRHAIEYLRSRDVECIKLDATPAGKPVYEKLGFREEWMLSRWETRKRSEESGMLDGDTEVTGICDDDLAQVAALDQEAFGAARLQLLAKLLHDSISKVRLKAADSEGHAFSREGSRARYFGPIAARTEGVAARLIRALMGQCKPGEAVFWDIPEANENARGLAWQFGFARQRSLTRMYLGRNTCSGNLSLCYGIAGPDLG